MTAVVDKTCTVKCDGCPTEVTGKSVRQIRRLLKKQGWHNRAGRDACPDCRQADFKLMY